MAVEALQTCMEGDHHHVQGVLISRQYARPDLNNRDTRSPVSVCNQLYRLEGKPPYSQMKRGVVPDA
jgi:hypothetical protein